MPRCPWCADPNADDDIDPELLCRMHLAEYEGLSLDELDRRDAEQASEEAEWVHGDDHLAAWHVRLAR